MNLFCRLPIAVTKTLPGPHGTTKSPPRGVESATLETRFAALLAREPNYLPEPEDHCNNAERAVGRPWYNVIPIVCVEV